MNLNKIRGYLYKFARILGDLNAIEKGKIRSRIVRRYIGRIVGQFLNKIFR